MKARRVLLLFALALPMVQPTGTGARPSVFQGAVFIGIGALILLMHVLLRRRAGPPLDRRHARRIRSWVERAPPFDRALAGEMAFVTGRVIGGEPATEWDENKGERSFRGHLILEDESGRVVHVGAPERQEVVPTFRRDEIVSAVGERMPEPQEQGAESPFRAQQVPVTLTCGRENVLWVARGDRAASLRLLRSMGRPDYERYLFAAAALLFMAIGGWFTAIAPRPSPYESHADSEILATRVDLNVDLALWAYLRDEAEKAGGRPIHVDVYARTGFRRCDEQATASIRVPRDIAMAAGAGRIDEEQATVVLTGPVAHIAALSTNTTVEAAICQGESGVVLSIQTPVR